MYHLHVIYCPIIALGNSASPQHPPLNNAGKTLCMKSLVQQYVYTKGREWDGGEGVGGGGMEGEDKQVVMLYRFGGGGGRVGGC